MKSVLRIIKFKYKIVCCDKGKTTWSPEWVERELVTRKRYFRTALNVWLDKNTKRLRSKVTKDGRKECDTVFASPVGGKTGRLKLCNKSVIVLDVYEEVEE